MMAIGLVACYYFNYLSTLFICFLFPSYLTSLHIQLGESCSSIQRSRNAAQGIGTRLIDEVISAIS